DAQKKKDLSGELARECEEFDPVLVKLKIPQSTLDRLHDKILECRLEKLELDAATVISRSQNSLASRVEFIRAIVTREIIRNFAEALIHEEKKYLWELNVWSKYRYLLDPEYSHP